jgi:(2Fe-2S) ferredoxin
MIDEDSINIVKEELSRGKPVEEIIAKLRKSGFKDEDIEEILTRCQRKPVVIKRPARTTTFKTVLSKKSLSLLIALVMAVLILIIIGNYVLVPESLEDKAKRIADSTSEAQLFYKATELQNRVVGCLDELYETYGAAEKAENAQLFEELKECTIISSKKIDKIIEGAYLVTFTVVEKAACIHQYVFDNNLLEVSVDIGRSATVPRWLVPPPFNEDAVNILYPQSGCENFIGYTQTWVDQFKNSS